jgi:DNA-binding transcriptional regulator YdaS (Cro superfamily)
MNTIKQAIHLVGGVTQLAKHVGVSQQAIHLWKAGKTQIMARHASAVQDATDGAVSAYDIGKEAARQAHEVTES